ncbi:hypothetical protein Taro_013418 [Colocasia esculenta]|uniref:non-specific serine/threonine protein kinase n=1 Tax=Colocasia esculenta TaxID=4460 RepID=A0A843UM24_COLES|nr:hypothetical protein [Colocasia esculenta]
MSEVGDGTQEGEDDYFFFASFRLLRRLPVQHAWKGGKRSAPCGPPALGSEALFRLPPSRTQDIAPRRQRKIEREREGFWVWKFCPVWAVGRRKDLILSYSASLVILHKRLSPFISGVLHIGGGGRRIAAWGRVRGSSGWRGAAGQEGMEERYELLKELGSGNFGVARLVKDRKTNELLAVKYIERGMKIDENVRREIVNHMSLRHPNIILFKEEICHRDLKLENTLLDGSPTPRLKICDFGYSKSGLLHSQPKSTVGTPAYIAPEVLSRKEYDGKIADVWSCGVTLYVMLVGAYPFEDPEDPRNFRKTLTRIMGVQYSIPDYVHVSKDCRHLLSRIFVANPSNRITIPEIKSHPWFLKNLPRELVDAEKTNYTELEQNPAAQSVEEIDRIIEEARTPAEGSKSIGASGSALVDADNLDDDDAETDDIDSSGDYLLSI